MVFRRKSSAVSAPGDHKPPHIGQGHGCLAPCPIASWWGWCRVPGEVVPAVGSPVKNSSSETKPRSAQLVPAAPCLLRGCPCPCSCPLHPGCCDGDPKPFSSLWCRDLTPSLCPPRAGCAALRSLCALLSSCCVGPGACLRQLLQFSCLAPHAMPPPSPLPAAVVRVLMGTEPLLCPRASACRACI